MKSGRREEDAAVCERSRVRQLYRIFFLLTDVSERLVDAVNEIGPLGSH